MIKSVDGSMCKCVEDCAIFLQAILDLENYKKQSLETTDLYFIPRPFDLSIYNCDEQINFGYIECIDDFPPNLSVLTSFQESIKKL